MDSPLREQHNNDDAGPPRVEDEHAGAWRAGRGPPACVTDDAAARARVAAIATLFSARMAAILNAED